MLTFSRPSKIKSITLWPRTGKHWVGINHLLFHAWLCSLFLDVWNSVCFRGNGWLVEWQADWLTGWLTDWLYFVSRLQSSLFVDTVECTSLMSCSQFCLRVMTGVMTIRSQRLTVKSSRVSQSNAFTSSTQKAFPSVQPRWCDAHSSWHLKPQKRDQSYCSDRCAMSNINKNTVIDCTNKYTYTITSRD